MVQQVPWRRLGSKVVYRNRWIRVREDRVVRPDGRRGIYGVVVSTPSVYIVAVTPQREVYLVKQYRYPTQMWSWEIPQGNSDGGALLSAAKRELQEETGLTAAHWRSFGRFQTLNGVSNEMGYLFLARGLKQTNKHEQREEGIVAMRVVPFPTLVRMIKRGTISDSLTITAVMKVALVLGWVWLQT